MFNERAMIEQAAMASFRRVYAQVAPYQEGKDTDATLSLTGDSYYNPIMRTYYVNMRASMYIGDAADSIGTYKAKAQIDAGMNDPDAFLKAYTIATDDIARQIVGSAEFAEAIRAPQSAGATNCATGVASAGDRVSFLLWPPRYLTGPDESDCKSRLFRLRVDSHVGR